MAYFERCLAGVFIFSALSDEKRRQVEQSCHWRQYPAGAEIITYCDDSDDVYFVAGGRVEARIHTKNGKDVAFMEIGPGQSFGELAAVDGEPRSATVEALEPTTVAIMPAVRFRELLLNEPRLMMALLVDVIGRLRATSDRLHVVATQTTYIRVCAELLRLAEEKVEAGGMGANRVVIDMPSLPELAARLGTGRAMVSRKLGKLKDDHIIMREGQHQLWVNDMARLAAIVHEALGNEA